MTRITYRADPRIWGSGWDTADARLRDEDELEACEFSYCRFRIVVFTGFRVCWRHA